mgnify:CR=1 FL=1
MYYSGNLSINPTQASEIEIVKPTKAFSRIFNILTVGSLNKKQERQTFTAISILQQFNTVFRNLKITNIIRLSYNDLPFYEDKEGVEGAFHNNFFLIGHANQKINSTFLVNYLRSPRVQHLLLTKAGSSTIPDLNHKDFYSIEFPLPPLPEQKKIAKILSTWDESIITTEQLLANSQQQKKSLMQQLLTGKKRFPGFKDEWKVLHLGDIFSRVTKKNTEVNTNVVTISAQQGLIRQEEFFKKTVASDILNNYFLLEKGQFAYNKSYSNGYPMGAIKRLNRYEKGVVTTLYICFEVSDFERCCPVYFEQYFDSGLLNKGLSQIAHEGGRAHGLLNVKPSDFFKLKITTPTLPEQQKTANTLTIADAEITTLQQKLDRLKQEKKALMQQLLTGKRRV